MDIRSTGMQAQGRASVAAGMAGMQPTMKDPAGAGSVGLPSCRRRGAGGVYRRQVSKPSAKRNVPLTTTLNAALAPLSDPLVAANVLPLASV